MYWFVKFSYLNRGYFNYRVGLFIGGVVYKMGDDVYCFGNFFLILLSSNLIFSNYSLVDKKKFYVEIEWVESLK